MSTYTPNYEENDVSAVPNCLCGASGKGRDENACRRRHSCIGCGFDKDEHQRRLNILRQEGLRVISFNHKSDLLHKYGVSGDLKLHGLRMRK